MADPQPRRWRAIIPPEPGDDDVQAVRDEDGNRWRRVRLRTNGQLFWHSDATDEYLEWRDLILSTPLTEDTP